MFGLGVTEILLILALLVLVFGASRLPKIARGLGEGIRNFKGEVKAGRDEPSSLPPGSSESERTSGGGDAAGP